jgi:hypothetical protein
VSCRTIVELERGQGRSPRLVTAELLATALGLHGDERDTFVDAARSQFWARRLGLQAEA